MERKIRQHVVEGKEIFVGLEDSKKTWKLSVRSEGLEVHFTSMPAQYGVLSEYFAGRFPGCRIHVIYEAGFRGFGLYDRLTAAGIRCTVTPPSRVTYEHHRRRKNDKIDARRLAVILEKGDYKSCHVPDLERREDRQLSRVLVGVQKDITRIRNRIRRFFDCYVDGADLPAGAWSEADYERGRHLRLNETLRKGLDVWYSALDHMKAHARELLAELRRLSRKERYAGAVKLLSSSPGIGWLTAIRLVLEWGEDWSRFGSSKQIASYSGLVCSEYSSGETEHKGRITGESHPFVRSWLVQCGWSAIRKDPVLLDKFQRVWKNSGSKKKAIVAVSRMLVVRLRALMLSHTPYCIGVAA
jgi:transposase